ncbi:peptidoglycan-binding protein [Streptomyces sp. NPDC001658]
MTESTTERRVKLAGLHERIKSADSKNDLIDAIDDALAVSAPEGDVPTLESLARRYREQVDDADRLRERIDKVATRQLPEVWVGTTSETASAVVSAASRAADQVTEAFRGGAKALLRLADALEPAQKLDAKGRGALREARGMLGGHDGWFDDIHEDDGEEAARLKARSLATQGVADLKTAAENADDAAREAARDLNKYAAEARAGQMDTDELTATDRLMLADTANPTGDRELNEILTANDLERAGQRMEGLPAADQERMRRLLADASTPQEKAYLMKALAAGYSVDEVEEFGGKIHGKDPNWLQSHLTPITTTNDPKDTDKESQWYGEKLWDQDGETCVPSSTVTARALVDPVYALELTGGPDGTDDSDEAFRERLTAEQLRMHEEGDGSNSGWLWDRKPAGMDPEGQTEISDKELSPHTGDRYEAHDMDSADDRRDVLPDIEKSVAEGKPVPINIERTDEDGNWKGHSMMVIGQEDGMLQIYNPWGTTTWVSEEDFINGDLSSATDERYAKKNDGDLNRVYIEQD